MLASIVLLEVPVAAAVSPGCGLGHWGKVQSPSFVGPMELS